MSYLVADQLRGGYGGADILNGCSLSVDKGEVAVIVGPNGAGKSTMLDALSFGLFGKAHRNIGKNQLVNSINKKSAVVEVTFQVSGSEYKIVRGIKPNIFEIWCDGEMINQEAAVKDYQEHLEKFILKLNYKSFTQIVILLNYVSNNFYL